jgi:hypothetical protein
MRTALLTATALVALSSLAVAQGQLVATEPAPKAETPKVRVNDPSAPGGRRLHYDVPCWKSAGADHCNELLPRRYVPNRPRP